MLYPKSTFIRCCYGYAVSGMSVLVVGAVLPSLIREAEMSFSIAGGLLSAMAVGNLLASLVYPMLASGIGRRAAITLLASMTPVCLFVLTLLPSILIMYLFMFLAGIARGAITIYNNAVVNEISSGSTKKLNLLHCSFAFGAFLAPFLTALLGFFGFGWRYIIYLLAGLCVTSAVSYGMIKLPVCHEVPYPKKLDESGTAKKFYQSFDFYCVGLVMFFYLGVENCINGWFVTYLQNTGVMSETYATSLVSVTWLVIMGGRLVCASLAQKYSKSTIILINAVGSGVCFIALIATSSLPVITASLIGFGFCLAGIYPTSVANIGFLIKGSTVGMSALTAISSLGGIITPQLVGRIADHIGIVAAIGLLAGNMLLVILLSFIILKRIR